LGRLAAVTRPAGGVDEAAARAWQTGAVPLLLIRHAHAGTRRDHQGPDLTRRLSARGARQARSLVRTLEGYSPQRILSSPATRCVETVTPLAEALRVKIEADQALSEGAGLAALALVRSVAHEKIALCTHGDVIPEILVALADEDHLDLGPRPRQAKGSVWVLEAGRSRFVKAAYLPASG
jgi:broad specificity phosphatase PhoE